MTVFSSNIPDGMVQLMKDLTKDILKERPDNIYEYAAQYFENLLKKRDGSLDKGYGKFRSYEKYCKFIEQLQMKQLKQQQEKQKLKNRQSSTSEKSSNSGSSSSGTNNTTTTTNNNNNNNNYETDSGVGSSNTDDETIKVGGNNSTGVLKKLEVNGRAVPVSKRNETNITTTTTNTNNKSIIQRRRKVNQKSLGVAAAVSGSTIAVATIQAATNANVDNTLDNTTDSHTTVTQKSYDDDDDDDVGATNDITELSVVGDDENNIESELFTEIENDNDSGEIIDNGRPYKSARPRKLSSKKPSENLIVIKEETSADVVAAGVITSAKSDRDTNDDQQNNAAAMIIQNAFRKFIANKKLTDNGTTTVDPTIKMDENMAALIIQKCLKGFIVRKAYQKNKANGDDEFSIKNNDNKNEIIEKNIELEPVVMNETQNQLTNIDIPTDIVENTEETDKNAEQNEQVADSKNDTDLNTNSKNEEKTLDNIEEKINEKNLTKNDLVNENSAIDIANESTVSDKMANDVKDINIDDQSDGKATVIDNSQNSEDKDSQEISNNVVNENPITTDHQSVVSTPTNEILNTNNNEKLIETSENIDANQDQQSVAEVPNNEAIETKNNEISENKLMENLDANENNESQSTMPNNEITETNNNEKLEDRASEKLENISNNEKDNQDQQSLIVSSTNEIESANNTDKSEEKLSDTLENISDTEKHNEIQQSLDASSKNETENIKIDEKTEDKLSEILENISDIENLESVNVSPKNDIENADNRVSEISENTSKTENNTNTDDSDTKTNNKSLEIQTDIVDSENKQSVSDISNKEDEDDTNNKKSEKNILETPENNSTNENLIEKVQPIANISKNEVINNKSDENKEDKVTETLGNTSTSENLTENQQLKITDPKNDEISEEKSLEIIKNEKDNENPQSNVAIAQSEDVDTKNNDKITETSESHKNFNENQQSIGVIDNNEVTDLKNEEKSEQSPSEILSNIEISDSQSREQQSVSTISNNELVDCKKDEKTGENIVEASETNTASVKLNEDQYQISDISKNELTDLKNDNEKPEEKFPEVHITDIQNDNATEISKNNAEAIEKPLEHKQLLASISNNEITNTNEEKLAATDVLDIQTGDQSEVIKRSVEDTDNDNYSKDHKSIGEISEINVTNKDQLSPLEGKATEIGNDEKSEILAKSINEPDTNTDTISKEHKNNEETTSNVLGNDLDKTITPENFKINEDSANTDFDNSKSNTQLEESISNNLTDDDISQTKTTEPEPQLGEKTTESPVTNELDDFKHVGDQQTVVVIDKNEIPNLNTDKNNEKNICEESTMDSVVENPNKHKELSDTVSDSNSINLTKEDLVTNIDKDNETADNIVQNSELIDLTKENYIKQNIESNDVISTGPSDKEEINDLNQHKVNVFDNKTNESTVTANDKDQAQHVNPPEITNEIKHDLSTKNDSKNEEDVPENIENINSDTKSTDILLNEAIGNENKEKTIKNIENPQENNANVIDKISSGIEDASINQNLKDISESDTKLEELNTPQSAELINSSANKEKLEDIDDGNKSVVASADISSIPKDKLEETNTKNSISDIKPEIADIQQEKLENHKKSTDIIDTNLTGELTKNDETELVNLESKMHLTGNISVDEYDLNKQNIDLDQDQANKMGTSNENKIDYPGSVSDKETGEIEDSKIDISDPIAKQLLSYSIVDSKDNTDSASDQNNDIEQSVNSEPIGGEKQLPLDMLSSFEEVGLKLVPTEIIEHAKLNDNQDPTTNNLVSANKDTENSNLNIEQVDTIQNKDVKLSQNQVTDSVALVEEENKSLENINEDQLNKTYTLVPLATNELSEINDNLDHTYTIHGNDQITFDNETILALENEKHSDELNKTFILEKNTVEKINDNDLDPQENVNTSGLKRIKRSLDISNDRSGEIAVDDDVDAADVGKNNEHEIIEDQIPINEQVTINKDNSEPIKIDPVLHIAEDPQLENDVAEIPSANIQPTSSDDSCDSDNGITFEVRKTNKNDKFKESGIDETSRDELSEIENLDLSSYGEDSLEAMYYSLKKNEIILNKMQEQKDAKSTNNIINDDDSHDDDDDDHHDDNVDTRKNFPQNITKTLGNAINQVMGSSNDNDDIVMGDGRLMSAESLRSSTQPDEPSSADEMFKEMDLYELNNSGNISYTNKTSEKPKKAPKKSKTVSYFDANDYADDDDDDDDNDDSRNRNMMTPMMASAMEQTSAFLHRIHGSIEEEKEEFNDDDEDYEQKKLSSKFSSYGSDEKFDHFPDDIDNTSYHSRNILAASISETDSDYFNPSQTAAAAITSTGTRATTAAPGSRRSTFDDGDEFGRLEPPLTKRLIKDDFNISTAFGHLTSTDSDSTIISAATKIQAGARGFLTRRRLRRSSNDTSTTTANDTFCSFGNAAIDKSLEDLIEQQEQIGLDEAAIKIQKSFRKYLLRKNEQMLPSKSDSNGSDQLAASSSSLSSSGEEKPISNSEYGGIIDITLGQKKLYENIQNLNDTDEDSSIENDRRQISVINTADNNNLCDTAQRRMTLQRGDAVQHNSTPDELSENNSSGDSVGGGGDGGGSVGSFKASAPSADDIIEPNVTSTEAVPGIITTTIAATAAVVAPPAAIATDTNIDNIDLTTNETDEKKINKVLSNTIKFVGQQHKTDQEVIKQLPSAPVTISTHKSTSQLVEGKTNFDKLIRQKSMPVQIDMEFMRIVPKHLRKRIKSADSQKKKR